MKTLHQTIAVCGLLVTSLGGYPTWADVLNMGGTRNPATGQWTGLASLETVRVGNPGNAGDTRYPEPYFGVTSVGSVGYTYNIGKYEVTAGQYCEFLNAVAKMDTYGLYNSNMSWTDDGSGIARSGSSGNYVYSVHSAFVNRPVNYVSFGDACRFANWLHNGQPTGAQDLSTTEDGAYYLNGATSRAALLEVTRKANWRWAVTSDDEWYKAAYYNPASGSYYDYPTSSNTHPGQSMADTSGNNANCYTSPYVYPIQSPYYTTVVGEFQNSDSPYGTFDQGGNVWEWTEAVRSDSYGSYRHQRGGGFGDYGDEMLASWGRIEVPSDESSGMGLRLVQAFLPGDVDGDGHVDVVDLLFLVDAFGGITGDANYDARCDLNRDGAVDVVDLLDLVSNFGK